MSTTPRILAFAGSTREGSFNQKLARIAAAAAASAGAEVAALADALVTTARKLRG